MSEGGFNRIGGANTTFTKAHENADTDVDEGSIHHTLGEGRYQAAPGIVVKQLEETVARLEAVVDAVMAQSTDLIGETKLWILDEAPPHFLACLGQTLLKADYPALWSALQDQTPDYELSPTQFQLPDSRHRFIVGADNDAGTNDGLALAAREAQNEHTHSHAGSAASGGGGTSANGGATTSSSTAHSHSVTAITTPSGDHDHAMGGPSATGTNYTTGGSGQAAGPSHTHDNTPAGNHGHLVSVTSSVDGGHSHTVGDHSHAISSHTHTVGANATDAGHSYLYMTVIIRYESGIDI